MLIVVGKRLSEYNKDENEPEREADMKAGFEAIDRFVQIVREAGGGRELLQKLRIPKMFRKRYEQAVDKSFEEHAGGTSMNS